jgi:hypothetical protein
MRHYCFVAKLLSDRTVVECDQLDALLGTMDHQARQRFHPIAGVFRLELSGPRSRDYVDQL